MMLKTPVYSSRIYVLVLLLLLFSTACTTSTKKTHDTISQQKIESSSIIDNKATAQVTPDLTKLSLDFLYLSSQSALAEGNGALAIKFLEALAKREPLVLEPRLQLIDLLMRNKQNKQALLQLDDIISQADANLSDKQNMELNLMRVRLLVSQKKFTEALDILTNITIKYPNEEIIQLYHVRLLAEMQRPKDALAVLDNLLKTHNSDVNNLLQVRLLLMLERDDEADKKLHDLQHLPQAALLQSELAARQQDWGKAENILRHFLKNYPANADISNTLAKMMIEQHRLHDAINIYDNMAKQMGSPVEIMKMLGLLHLQVGQYTQAEIVFSQAVENYPDNKQLLYFLAIAFEHNNKHDQAAALYKQFGKDDTSYAEVQLRLSEMDWDAGNYAAIEQRLRALLVIQPEYSEAYVYLATSLLEQKRFEDVLILIDTASNKLSDLSPELLMKRAAALEELNRLEEAEIVLRQIYDLTPDNVEVLNFLGYVLAERGHKLQEAETLILAALARKPNDAYYLDSLAWVYFQDGVYEKALKTQLKAYHFLKDDPIVNEHLGDIYWRLNAANDARHYWQRALDANHQQPELIKQKIIDGLKP
ncbi:MAG: tetratricopeptide repeat protein [Mariprofundales bacterium]